MSSLKSDIEKGCGKKFNEMIGNNIEKLWQCGGQKDIFDEEIELCQTCQAKLSIIARVKDVIKELRIERKLNKRWINLDELNLALFGDEE